MSALDAMPGFTFGCDPELFIRDDKGVVVSAAGLIPGDKQNPYKVKGGAIQVDGMAAEFNIDPVTNYADFTKNINTVLRELRTFLPRGYELVPIPSVEFSKEVWDAAPDKAKELGCTPDYNAWTGTLNPPPANLEKPTLRCAGGHLHIGWTNDADITERNHILNCVDLVKQLDWYLGGWSIHQDNDNMRRSLYGSAGACRFKPYGVEYRTLSNFWLTSSAKREAVWNRMQKAIHDMRTDFTPDKAEALTKRTNYDFNKALIRSINESQPDTTLQRNFRFPLIEVSRGSKATWVPAPQSISQMMAQSDTVAAVHQTLAQGQQHIADTAAWTGGNQ